MALVLDASVAIAWMFADESSDASEQALTQVSSDGARVPSLWRLEVANVLRKAVRRGRCDDAYAALSLDRLSQLAISVDTDTDRHAWGATRDLAIQHDLTVYDAAYLELAIRSKLCLASNDAALLRAARKIGLTALGD